VVSVVGQIFNKLFKKQKNITIEPSSSPPKDEKKAECPYCHQALDKIPSRKTKCPHCGEFMFVRTRPKDNARVVVTKEEADRIEEEWAIVHGTHDIYIANKKRIEKEKETLRRKFGKEPSDNDVEWSLLNKDLINHAKRGDWGLYSNARFKMAEILYQEKRLKEALETYLEVCYLDLNGPSNLGGMRDPQLLKESDLLNEFLPFDPESGFLAPGVIKRILRIINKLGLEKEELKSEFLKHNARIHKALKLPLSPEDSWLKIEDEIWRQ